MLLASRNQIRFFSLMKFKQMSYMLLVLYKHFYILLFFNALNMAGC